MPRYHVTPSIPLVESQWRHYSEMFVFINVVMDKCVNKSKKSAQKLTLISLCPRRQSALVISMINFQRTYTQKAVLSGLRTKNLIYYFIGDPLNLFSGHPSTPTHDLPGATQWRHRIERRYKSNIENISFIG